MAAPLFKGEMGFREEGFPNPAAMFAIIPKLRQQIVGGLVAVNAYLSRAGGWS